MAPDFDPNPGTEWPNQLYFCIEHCLNWCDSIANGKNFFTQLLVDISGEPNLKLKIIKLELGTWDFKNLASCKKERKTPN